VSFYLYSCCCVLIWVRKRPKAKLRVRVRALLRGATRKVNLHSRGLGGGGWGGAKQNPAMCICRSTLDPTWILDLDPDHDPNAVEPRLRAATKIMKSSRLPSALGCGLD
jgi:hypothetical protein